MELRQITTFIRAAQFESFSKAAASLGYSQSAVTVQIRQLEEELHVRLFDRMYKRVVLTAQGKQFLDSAYNIIQEVNHAALSLSVEGELNGQLHIGTLESLCYARLPGIVRRFRVQHPKVSIQITTGIPEELIAKMERGELDIIYILEEPLYNNSWCKVLERQEEVVVVASAELGRELGPGPHHLVDLLDRPFYLTERDANYRRLLDRRLATLDRAITPALESSYASFLLRVLEETEGLSFLPRFLVEEPVQQGKLTVVEVSDLQAVMYEQIFYHREKWATREMEAFIRFCAPEAAAWVGAAAPGAVGESGTEL
ncbi:LysR family transcriptional regulator [Intestinimonas sp. HCP28S3_D6]|uniref:LysR family transcriptional regulator n=1 Tax=Intestinimonas sp. HCP28S3_D6 TaxID=3438942 RepID=UPI003F8A8D46